MNSFTVLPSTLSGTITVPPSKSHAQRAILFSMLAKGTSFLENILLSPDCDAMIDAISLFGSKVKREEKRLTIQGRFNPPLDVIDVGNSGLALRFIGALAALQSGYTTITGDKSVRMNRPIKPLLHGIRQLGGIAESARGDGHAPIMIRGPMHSGVCRIDGQDSQPISALLIATSFLKGPTDIYVDSPGELPWIDVTLDWLRNLGAEVSNESYCHYHVSGGLTYEGLNYTVPGDWSTAAFPLVAALITKSSIEIEGLDREDIQGDKKIVEILQKMGANIHWKGKTLFVAPSELHGIDIDINTCIDALPILAVVGCFAHGTTRLYNGAIARKKESDRILSTYCELKKMGAQIEELPDGLVIYSSNLVGTCVSSHFDHRIALALAVAGLGARGETHIEGTKWIAKTYPSFIEDFSKLGANFELDPVRV